MNLNLVYCNITVDARFYIYVDNKINAKCDKTPHCLRHSPEVPILNFLCDRPVEDFNSNAQPIPSDPSTSEPHQDPLVASYKSSPSSNQLFSQFFCNH